MGASKEDRWAHLWQLILVLASVALINSDQNLLAPNLSACAEDFGLTPLEKDQQLGGGLAMGLFVVGAPAAIIVGAFADASSHRVRLLAIVLLLGAVGCALSAASRNYEQLFVARSITGVSLGGGLPLTFSIVGDMFDPSALTAISGRIGFAMLSGQVAGQTLAGLIGPSLGWRAPFWLVSVAMGGVSVIISVAMREPPRRIPPGARGGGRSPMGSGMKSIAIGWLAIFRVPSVWLVFLQGLPGCIPWGVIIAFLPDYLHQQGGFSVYEATLIMGAFSVGGGLGTFVGGEGGQLLYNRSPRLPALLMLVMGSLGVLPFWIIISHTPPSLLVAGALACIGGVCATTTGPMIRATLTNVTATEQVSATPPQTEPTSAPCRLPPSAPLPSAPPLLTTPLHTSFLDPPRPRTRPPPPFTSQRGVAFAAFALFDDIGKGAGPVVIARMVKTMGRRRAFSLAMLGWLPCAILCGATALTVEADEERLMVRGAGKGKAPKKGGGRGGGDLRESCCTRLALCVCEWLSLRGFV